MSPTSGKIINSHKIDISGLTVVMSAHHTPMPRSLRADAAVLVGALGLSLTMQEEEAPAAFTLLIASRQKVHRVQGPLSAL